MIRRFKTYVIQAATFAMIVADGMLNRRIPDRPGRTVCGLDLLRRLACVLLAWGVHAAAQGVNLRVPVNAECMELNQTVTIQVASGRFQEAEIALAAGLASGANRLGQACAGLILNNLAAKTAVSGRFAEAEVLAARSLSILGGSYPQDDPVLLRPLQTLFAVRFEQGKIAKAREASMRMRSIRIERPEDCALVAGVAASLLQAEGRPREAESEYLSALSAWERAGRGATADAASILNFLGSLYIEERRFEEARRALDTALSIFTTDQDAVPMDRMKLLNLRSVLYARQGEWRDAEEDLRVATSIADRETGADPVFWGPMWANYAYVLRKNHKGREARSFEARAAALHAHDIPDSLVDVTELLRKPTSPNKVMRWAIYSILSFGNSRDSSPLINVFPCLAGERITGFRR
jgi:tetratricopeptide (TPR) repeat protein